MTVEIRLQDLANGLVNLAREIARAEAEVEMAHATGADPPTELAGNLAAMRKAHAVRLAAVKKLMEK